MGQPSQEVVITYKNTVSVTLGIISTVIGVLALLFGWIPFFGLLAIPFAVIGGLFALLGIIIALFKRLRGAGLPLLGGAICTAAVILPLVSTGGTSAAINEAIDEVQEKRQTRQRKDDADKTTYIAQHLELYDVSAKYRESLLDGRVPHVALKLRNNGERSLEKVEVTVYFQDAQGKVISEEKYHHAKPLKPGYVWQMEKGRFYSAKPVPSEWQEGSVSASITDIKFTQ